MSGIYIHIPFCKQACSYCDFYFVTQDRLIPDFLDALICEVNSVPVCDGTPFPGDPIRSVYLGGGTPSRLSTRQRHRLFDALHKRFDLSEVVECTIEVNPEDITAEGLADMKDGGITRLSLGIQSFQAELLKFMNRAHSAEQARQVLEFAVNAGFTSYSADLIYGCPGQKTEQLLDDMKQLLEYDPPHVSAYSLTIEPRTRLGKLADLGRLAAAGENEIAEQSHLLRQMLASHGINRYEVSNYAVPGHEAVHNSAYWSHENYLGLGPSSHSFHWPPEQYYAVRWHHPPDIHAYIRTVSSPDFQDFLAAMCGQADHAFAREPWSRKAATSETTSTKAKNRETSTPEMLSLETLAGERLMTGLRTVRGIDREELASRYDYHLHPSQLRQIAVLRKEGFMEQNDPLRLTGKGFDLADAVTLRLL